MRPAPLLSYSMPDRRAKVELSSPNRTLTGLGHGPVRVCGSLICDARVVRDQGRASLWPWAFDAPQLHARLHLMLLAPRQGTAAYDGKHRRARPYVDKACHGSE